MKLVYEDNQSCIRCITNENYERMKYIKLKFIWDVRRNNIKNEYISSANQIANMLTKALSKIKFLTFMIAQSYDLNFQFLKIEIGIRCGIMNGR